MPAPCNGRHHDDATSNAAIGRRMLRRTPELRSPAADAGTHDLPRRLFLVPAAASAQRASRVRVQEPTGSQHGAK